MAEQAAYLSNRSAAVWLDVSVKTIERLREAGEIEGFKLTDAATSPVRISRASLEAYAARRRGRRMPHARRPADERFPIPALQELRAAKARRRLETGGGEEAAA